MQRRTIDDIQEPLHRPRAELEAEEWVKEELAEQEERFAKIEAAMEDLAPTREKWYQEFFDRLRTNGFNMDGDDKMPIPESDLPVKPADRKRSGGLEIRCRQRRHPTQRKGGLNHGTTPYRTVLR